MATRKRIYRQGDVWIYSITEKEFTERRKRAIHRDERKGLILAEGEVTGHHHRIPEGGRLYDDEQRNEVRLLSASRPISLQHEEHETIEIPAGKYEVRIQREYAPEVPSRQTRVYD